MTIKIALVPTFGDGKSMQICTRTKCHLSAPNTFCLSNYLQVQPQPTHLLSQISQI